MLLGVAGHIHAQHFPAQFRAVVCEALGGVVDSGKDDVGCVSVGVGVQINKKSRMRHGRNSLIQEQYSKLGNK